MLQFRETADAIAGRLPGPVGRQEGLAAVSCYDIEAQLDRYADRLASLTLRQRQCMVLVDQGLISKVVATLLEISASRVDKHVLDVRRLLDNLPRRTAARLVAEYEMRRENDTQGGQLMGALSLPLAPRVYLDPDGRTANGVSEQDTPADMHDGPGAVARWDTGMLSPERLPRLLGLQSHRRRASDLDPSTTLTAVGLLTFGILATAASALSLLVAFSALWQR